jgi:uncharacterized protein YkwD
VLSFKTPTVHRMSRPLHRVRRERCLLLLLVIASSTAHASPVSIANSIRREGCDARAGVASALREDAKTSQIARRWSKGGRLAEFIPQGFGQARFASLHLQGVRDETALARALRSQFCQQLTSAAFTQIGVYGRGDAVWFVVSSAKSSPRASDAPAIREEVLRLVNQARGQSRRCGTQTFPMAEPLKLNTQLNRAAEAHARNMAQHRKLQHEGFDGSTPASRASAAGYAWRAVGENIAAGPVSAAEVVQMWLDSPGHCGNLMNRNFAEMGLAYAEEEQRETGVYWVQAFGRRR